MNALDLLLAAIVALSSQPYDVQCTPAQVQQMQAEVRQHPDYSVRGMLGLVRRTCQ